MHKCLEMSWCWSCKLLSQVLFWGWCRFRMWSSFSTYCASPNRWSSDTTDIIETAKDDPMRQTEKRQTGATRIPRRCEYYGVETSECRRRNKQRHTPRHYSQHLVSKRLQHADIRITTAHQFNRLGQRKAIRLGGTESIEFKPGTGCLEIFTCTKKVTFSFCLFVGLQVFVQWANLWGRASALTHERGHASPQIVNSSS